MNRLLLQHGFQEEEEGSDYMDLNSYDEYDWIILGLSLAATWCIWCCIGWCIHRQCVKHSIMNEEDFEEYSVRKKISMTWKNTVSNRLIGLPVIQNRNTLSTTTMKINYGEPKTPSNYIPSSAQQTPTESEADIVPKEIRTRMNRIPSDAEVNWDQYPAIPHFTANITNFDPSSADGKPSTTTSTGNKRQSLCIYLDKKMMHKLNGDNPLKLIISDKENKQDKKTSFVMVTTPSVVQPTSAITPGYGVTPGLATPDSAMPSESHICIQIPIDYSENPYVRAVTVDDKKDDKKNGKLDKMSPIQEQQNEDEDEDEDDNNDDTSFQE